MLPDEKNFSHPKKHHNYLSVICFLDLFGLGMPYPNHTLMTASPSCDHCVQIGSYIVRFGGVFCPPIL